MAFQQNPDGSWMLVDETGMQPPVPIPANLAPNQGYSAPPAPAMVEPGPQGAPPYYLDPNPGTPEAPNPHFGKPVDSRTGQPVGHSTALIEGGIRPAPARSQTIETATGPLPAPPAPLAAPQPGAELGILPTPPNPISIEAGEPTRKGEPFASPNLLNMGETFAPPPRQATGPEALSLEGEPGSNLGDMLGPKITEPQRDTPAWGMNVLPKQEAPLPFVTTTPQGELPAGARYGGVKAPGAAPGSLPAGARYAKPSGPTAAPGDIVTAGQRGADDTTPMTPDTVMADPQQQLLAAGVAEEVERMTGTRRYIGPTPARDVLKSWNIRKQAPIAPERKEGLLDAMRGQAMATAHGGDVTAAGFEARAVAEGQKANDLKRQAAELQKRAADEQRVLREHMNPINAELDAIRREAAVNPVERYYERKGAGSRILGKIGMALMALAGAVSPVGIKGMELLQEEMRQDVEDEVNFQKQKLDSMALSVNARRGLLADLRATMMSPEAAENAARALLLEANASELRKMAALTAAPEARQAAIEAASALSVKAQGLMAEVEQQEGGEISLSGVHKPASAGGFAPTPSKLDIAARIAHKTGERPMTVLGWMGDIEAGRAPQVPQGKMDRAGVQMMESVMARAVTLPNGSIVYAGDVSTKQKSELKLKYGNMMLENLKEIARITGQGGTFESLPTESRARVQAIAAQNAYLLKPTLGEALSIGEVERLWGNLIGDHPTDLFSFASNNKAKLDQTIRGTQQLLDAELGSLHIDPWKPSPIGKILTTVPQGAKKIEK